MAQMAPEERLALIKENLAEFLDFDIIEKIVNEGKDPKVYWGTYVVFLLLFILLSRRWKTLSD